MFCVYAAKTILYCIAYSPNVTKTNKRYFIRFLLEATKKLCRLHKNLNFFAFLLSHWLLYSQPWIQLCSKFEMSYSWSSANKHFTKLEWKISFERFSKFLVFGHKNQFIKDCFTLHQGRSNGRISLFHHILQLKI